MDDRLTEQVVHSVLEHLATTTCTGELLFDRVAEEPLLPTPRCLGCAEPRRLFGYPVLAVTLGPVVVVVVAEPAGGTVAGGVVAMGWVAVGSWTEPTGLA